MHSLPIAPDESGDVPRCRDGCGHFDIERFQRGPDWYDEHGICLHEIAMREPGDLCLPRIRELVALSRRRCDGCKYWARDRPDQRHGFCDQMSDDYGSGWAEDDCCSRWEAKR